MKNITQRRVIYWNLIEGLSLKEEAFIVKYLNWSHWYCHLEMYNRIFAKIYGTASLVNS